jgi:hypothetical protein
LEKYDLGHILGEYFTNTSGHLEFNLGTGCGSREEFFSIASIFSPLDKEIMRSAAAFKSSEETYLKGILLEKV